MPQMPMTQTWHLPQPDVETQPFWDATAHGKLLIKHCTACDRPFFYPRDHCPRCWSTETEWREAAGTGTLYTFTVIHGNDLPPFRDRLPYVVAIVDLDEGVRMTSNLEGADLDAIACGMKVRVDFRAEQRDDDTIHLPIFRPA